MKLRPGTIAVVTGAGSGIGRALALNLAARGCALALGDIRQAGLDETAALAGPSNKISTHIVDVSNLSAVERFADEVVERHGGAQLLINNAGVALGGAFSEVTLEDFAWLMGINFWGEVYGCKVFLPILRRQPAAHIVNLSSVFGLVAPPGQAAYASSKFAVRGFTQALRGELRGTTISVSCVHPGGVATNIARNARSSVPLDPAQAKAAVEFAERTLRMPPEQAAAIIVRGIERDKPRILVGNDARLLDALARLLPTRLGDILASGRGADDGN